MADVRQSRSLTRRFSDLHSDSSASTSPERARDDDNDSLMQQANDSVSSLAVSEPDTPNPSRDWEERCRVSPISRLPAELMIAIFQRLPKNSDLLNCMQVSHDWARNSVALLWHRPTTTNWPGLHSVVQTIRSNDSLFDYNRLVKRLNLSLLNNQVSDGTLLPFQSCKRVERLTLTNCQKLTDLSIASVIEGNHSLMALDVTGIEGVTDQTMYAVARHCYRLQGLNITNCRKVTDDSLIAIAQNCRHLKRLKFNGCGQITDHSVIAFANNCRQLLEIDLADCRKLEDDAVTAIMSEGMNLRELRLAHCVRITDSAFLNLPHDLTYENLRIMDLTDCGELKDEGVQKIISAAPRLRNLVLAKCRQITDRAIMAVTRLGKNLHYIHLGHCARITDAGVLQLVKLCNRIRYIDLACCTNLTDASITTLATLPKLKRIGLVKCGNITDLSIYALAKPKAAAPPSSPSSPVPSSLERVHLSYCTNLTLPGITSLLNNCPRLTHLSLTGVQAFLREDLLVFCREAPPEFNDHQRDVFCVFSGNGVTRLRQYLNQDHRNLNMDGGPFDDNQIVDDSDLGPPPNPPFHHTGNLVPPPPPPPAFHHPLTLTGAHPPAHAHPGPLHTLPHHPPPLAPLQIPQGPPAMGSGSPTQDAPLSVDEGEEFNEFPEPAGAAENQNLQPQQ